MCVIVCMCVLVCMLRYVMVWYVLYMCIHVYREIDMVWEGRVSIKLVIAPTRQALIKFDSLPAFTCVFLCVVLPLKISLICTSIHTYEHVPRACAASRGAARGERVGLGGYVESWVM